MNEQPGSEAATPSATAGTPGAHTPTGRRHFFSRAGAVAAAALAATTFDHVRIAGGGASVAEAAEIGPAIGAARADAALNIRTTATTFQRAIALPDHPDNGDEARYTSRLASYHKALQHDANGDVVAAEYTRLLSALNTGVASDFEALALTGARNLSNPLAAYAYSLAGADSHALAIPSAPAFESAEAQAELAELYWMALARDVPFSAYSSNAIIGSAVSDLNRFSQLRAPTQNGQVTRASIFRDVLPSNLVGPYVSQFLLKTVPYGVQEIVQRNRTRVSGDDRVTTFDEWLRIQNGSNPAAQESFDGTRRYIRNGRDLAEWVHADFPVQAALNTALILAAQGNTIDDIKFSPGINDSNSPYESYQDQNGFITLGNQQFLDLVAQATQQALQAAWYQKWLVHRRLRPEEYGGRVEGALRRSRSYPIGNELRASQALAQTLATFGSYLLPQAYPEGSPTHPAYPSGHSTYIAAGVTMIKAFANGSLNVASPVTPNSDGTALVSYSGTLILANELDKLVMNIGMGRMFAGVHYRSDHAAGVRLGELVAIRLLHDLTRTLIEPFRGFSLRTFGGTDIRITSTGIETNQSSPTAISLSNAVPAIDRFVLINTDTDQPVAAHNPLRNNATLTLASLPPNLNIQGVAAPDQVGSVRFEASRNGTAYPVHVENTFPYAALDAGTTDYEPWPFQTGTHVITATPFSGAGARGTAGIPLTIRFVVA